ncbi:MAG: hypothetical protein XD95_0509, partial [Microgenomates bacterium 39_7]
MQKRRKHLQSGQVGVITLLIMAVILTVAIGLSQRTTQQQDAAFIQDESTRVFNAAESGIEEALSAITEAELVGETADVEDSFTLGDDEVSYSGQAREEFEMFVAAGDTVELPIDLPQDTNLDISWWEGESNCANDPSAIIVSVLSANNAKHYGFDPCAADRDTNFASTQPGSGGYAFRVTVPLTTDDVRVRIKPIFNSTKFLMNSNAITLAQYTAESTGLNTQ